MEKKVAIVQSNYIPWRGYFDLLSSVDEFIIFDNAQYTRRDWRNRNIIKTANGNAWLTIPVKTKGNYHVRIRDIEVDGNAWQENHWKSIEMSYRRSQFFEEIEGNIRPLYREKYSHLSAVNRAFIDKINTLLGIKTKISISEDFEEIKGKNERLIFLAKQAKADIYVSGPSAKAYIDEQMFLNSGIKVSWFDYAGYAEYKQLWGKFEPFVSVLDLLFNCGPTASSYLKSKAKNF